MQDGKDSSVDRSTEPGLEVDEALTVLDALPALDSLSVARLSPYVFAGPRGRPFVVRSFGRRDWGSAVRTSGIATPARLYDLRSTFATNALAPA